MSKKMKAGIFAFAAQNYLARYFATRFMLKRVLDRRARRFIKKHGGTMEEAQPLIEKELQKHIDSGAINDLNFAQVMIAELSRQGYSKLKIRQKLYLKGVDASTITEAFEDADDEPRKAALRYAKKRGFGPYRAPHITEDRSKKELMSMVRAGHPYGISKEIIALSREDIEEEE